MHRAPLPSSPRRVAPRRWWIAAGAGVLALGLVGAPAAAQTAPTTTLPPVTGPGPVDVDPPKTPEQQADAEKAQLETLAQAPKAEDTPPSPDDPFAAVVKTKEVLAKRALARFQATARSDKANVKALAAASALRVAKVKEQAAIDVRKEAIAELSAERKRLADLTVRAYVTGGNTDLEQYRAFVEGDTTDPAAGRQILFSQVLDRQKEVTKDAHHDLNVARAKLKDVRAVVKVAEDKAVRLLGIAADLTQRRAAAEQAHLDALQASNEADTALRSAAAFPGIPAPQEIPLIGLPRLSASDLALWFAQSSYRPRVTTPIEDYARWFIEEGRAEGIRGDVAFAQAVLETGGFANTDSVLGNNFSGIGHYDNLPLGWTFPSPRLGVRAQIQLLKSYAVKKPHYANTLVDKRLHGPAGCCQTWGDLTTVWATDPTYGPKVMLIYTSIVDFALQRRARGEGFDDAVPAAN